MSYNVNEKHEEELLNSISDCNKITISGVIIGEIQVKSPMFSDPNQSTKGTYVQSKETVNFTLQVAKLKFSKDNNKTVSYQFIPVCCYSEDSVRTVKSLSIGNFVLVSGYLEIYSLKTPDGVKTDLKVRVVVTLTGSVISSTHREQHYQNYLKQQGNTNSNYNQSNNNNPQYGGNSNYNQSNSYNQHSNNPNFNNLNNFNNVVLCV